MEKALRDLGKKTLAKTEHLHDDWTLVEEYPLSPSLLAMSRVWKSPDQESYIIAATINSARKEGRQESGFNSFAKKTAESLSPSTNVVEKSPPRPVKIIAPPADKTEEPQGKIPLLLRLQFFVFCLDICTTSYQGGYKRADQE
jgi:hypothetical protein